MAGPVLLMWLFKCYSLSYVTVTLLQLLLLAFLVFLDGPATCTHPVIMNGTQ